MEMMHWYNPLTMEEEEVSAPMSDAQARDTQWSPGFRLVHRRVPAAACDADGCRKGPHLHGRDVLQGAPEGAAPRLAAHLTAVSCEVGFIRPGLCWFSEKTSYRQLGE